MKNRRPLYRLLLHFLACISLLTPGLLAQGPGPQELDQLPRQEQVRQLQSDYDAIWAGSHEFLRNQIVHSIKSELSKEDIRTSRTSLDMSRGPRFEPTRNGIRFALPGTPDESGRMTYRIRTNFRYTKEIDYFFDLVVSGRVSIYIGLTCAVGTEGITNRSLDFHVDIEKFQINFLGEIDADGMEQMVTQLLRSKISGKLDKAMGGLNQMKWAPESPVRYQRQFQRVPTGFSPEEGERRVKSVREISPEKNNWHGSLRIALVADNFTLAEQHDFNVIAQSMSQKLTNPAEGDRSAEPFASYRRLFRVFRVNTITSDATDPAQSCVASYRDGGSDKSALTNLARLSRITHELRGLEPDVIVLVTNAARVQSRAMTQGPIILMPSDVRKLSNNASVLLHELGHTPLGGLSDEYEESAMGNQTYQSFEPSSPNVTTNSRGEKWAFWRNHPEHHQDWDPAVGAFEGSYYFKRGIYRPVHECKMRRGGVTAGTAERTFCPICRESMARKIRNRMNQRLSTRIGTGKIKASYSAPFRLSEIVHERAQNDDRIPLRFHDRYASHVRLTIENCNLPLPWRVRWTRGGRYDHPNRYEGHHFKEIVYDGTGNLEDYSVEVQMYRNDRIRLEVTSLNGFTPREAHPNWVVHFRADQPHLPEGRLSAPSLLDQSVPLGGTLTSGGSITLRARGGAFPNSQNWRGLVGSLEFRLTGQLTGIYGYRHRRASRFSKRIVLGGISQGEMGTVTFRNLRPGNYRWEVRYLCSGHSSTNRLIQNLTTVFWIGGRRLIIPDIGGNLPHFRVVKAWGDHTVGHFVGRFDNLPGPVRNRVPFSRKEAEERYNHPERKTGPQIKNSRVLKTSRKTIEAEHRMRETQAPENAAPPRKAIDGLEEDEVEEKRRSR